MMIDSRFAAFPLRVGSSAIDRRGVFAEAAIPPRRKVVEYTGEKIPLQTSLRRIRRILFGKNRRGHRRLYLARVNRGYSIDGAIGGSGAEFVNHCCDPNLVTEIRKGHILYMSRKPIRRGDELTVDYHFGKDIEEVPCKCGAKTCRGTINLK